MKKRVVLLVAVAALLVFAAGAFAGSSIEAIQANLAHDIKFLVDGDSFVAKDGDAVLSPIVYKDRTYLPVRSLGEALGVAVDWDKDTRTVILGDKPAVVVPEEPIEEEPVVEEEPVEEEPAPAADLAIAPAKVDFNKNAPKDFDVDITWGPATKITGMKGTALGGAVNITPVEGTHYAVAGDVLTIKSDLTALLPVPIAMVPTGTELTLTISFDNGSKDLVIKVVE